MKNYLTIVLVILLSSFISKTVINDELIKWSYNKLTWDDFKKPVTWDPGNFNAEIQCQIKIDTVYLVNNVPKVKVGCYMEKNNSWGYRKSESTLAHEQLHFDINELYTRKIRKKIKELNNKNITDIKMYQKTYTDLVKESEVENTKYDNQVYFNEIKQKQWIERINKELLDYKDYYEE